MPSAPMKVHETSGREVPGTRTICAECQGDVFRFYDLDGHNHMECVACGARYCERAKTKTCPGYVLPPPPPLLWVLLRGLWHTSQQG